MESAVCIKCGATVTNVVYCRGAAVEYCGAREFGEHLDRKCHDCGYMWAVPCKDATAPDAKEGG